MFDTPSHHRRSFMFWSLLPFLLLFLVLMPLLVEMRTNSAFIAIVSLELLVGLLLLALFDPARFWWAGRGVGAIIFLGYAVYLIALLLTVNDLIAEPRRSAPTALNATLGLIVFGVPGLCYAFFGRFSFRKPEEFQGDDEEFTEEDAGNDTDD